MLAGMQYLSYMAMNKLHLVSWELRRLRGSGIQNYERIKCIRVSRNKEQTKIGNQKGKKWPGDSSGRQ